MISFRFWLELRNTPAPEVIWESLLLSVFGTSLTKKHYYLFKSSFRSLEWFIWNALLWTWRKHSSSPAFGIILLICVIARVKVVFFLKVELYSFVVILSLFMKMIAKMRLLLKMEWWIVKNAIIYWEMSLLTLITLRQLRYWRIVFGCNLHQLYSILQHKDYCW